MSCIWRAPFAPIPLPGRSPGQTAKEIAGAWQIEWLTGPFLVVVINTCSLIPRKEKAVRPVRRMEPRAPLAGRG